MEENKHVSEYEKSGRYQEEIMAWEKKHPGIRYYWNDKPVKIDQRFS